MMIIIIIIIFLLLIIMRLKIRFIFCYPDTLSRVFNEQYMVFVFSRLENWQPYYIIKNVTMFQAVPFHV